MHAEFVEVGPAVCDAVAAARERAVANGWLRWVLP